MPFSFSGGIICGPHVDHLRFGIISGLGIICSRGSFTALYSTFQDKILMGHYNRSKSVDAKITELKQKNKKLSNH